MTVCLWALDIWGKDLLRGSGYTLEIRRQPFTEVTSTASRQYVRVDFAQEARLLW